MLDPIERSESRIESWAQDNVDGDRFRCSCGKWCEFMLGETLSPDPYAEPVCPECFERAMDEKYPDWREKMKQPRDGD